MPLFLPIGRRPLPAAALAALAATGLAAAQAPPQQQQQPPQQQPVFRVGAETVVIYASVLDEFGGLVTDLTPDDFEVRDDGRKRVLTAFANTFQPISATLLIDSSASMTLALEQAMAAAEQFVIRLMPDDWARAGSFADKVRWATEFTGDRDELLRGLRDNLDIGNPTRLWDSIDETRRELASSGGRRVLMLFTDGSDTASELRRDRLLADLRGDEIMIYVVQFPMRSWPDVELSLYQSARYRPPAAGERRPRSARDAMRQATEGLRALARQTGGGHFLLNPYDDLNATFTQVTQELHHQYLLGFTPERRDGRIHTIEVRTTRGATVRARRSYVAPRPDPGRP